jgi:hypothetical protein
LREGIRLIRKERSFSGQNRMNLRVKPLNLPYILTCLWFVAFGVLMPGRSSAAMELTGAGSTFGLSVLFEGLLPILAEQLRRDRELSIDRKRRRHSTVHREDRRFRGERRADECGGTSACRQSGAADSGNTQGAKRSVTTCPGLIRVSSLRERWPPTSIWER